MKEIMDWNVCLREHIKKIEPDFDKISSIRKMCSIRLKILKGIKVDDESASVIATDYYEIIKELLVALLLKNGLKSDNHECLISFFKYRFPDYEYEVNAMHKLKNARNRISYDGVFVRKDYIDANRLEFENIIDLIGKILEDKS